MFERSSFSPQNILSHISSDAGPWHIMDHHLPLACSPDVFFSPIMPVITFSPSAYCSTPKMAAAGCFEMVVLLNQITLAAIQ
jgi:hypothetical protein